MSGRLAHLGSGRIIIEDIIANLEDEADDFAQTGAVFIGFSPFLFILSVCRISSAGKETQLGAGAEEGCRLELLSRKPTPPRMPPQ